MQEASNVIIEKGICYIPHIENISFLNQQYAILMQEATNVMSE